MLKTVRAYIHTKQNIYIYIVSTRCKQKKGLKCSIKMNMLYWCYSIVVCRAFDGICRRGVNNEPHVNIKNIIVINIRITVDIGEKRARYLIRKYHINPRINDNNRTKCDEILTGDGSINADVSKVFRFI